MKKLILRLKKRYEITIKNWKCDCFFSVKYAVLRLIDDVSGRLRIKIISDWAYERKEQWIINYLENTIQPVIEKYSEIDDEGVREMHSPIWVCWWTGMDSAPLLVKQCIKSICANAGSHPINIITQDNYTNYLKIPDYILDKIKSGKMGLAHFADYMRVCLLAEYGGLWIDATIFCSKVIPEYCFDSPFFTCKSEYKESRYISRFQWVTFCLGGWKNNIVYSFLKEAFEIYWQKSEFAIDYLFFDYMIYLAKEKIPAVKKHMNAVPINNVHRDDLQAAMNLALPAEEFEKVLQEDTTLYKLSWREEYSEVTVEGRDSIYRRFLHMQ